MKRLLILAFIVFLLNATAAAQSVMPFEHGPYSGAPGANNITISWLIPKAMSASLTYDLASNFASSQKMMWKVKVPASSDPEPKTTEIQLNGLEPDTKYAYQVIVQSGSQKVRSPIGYFHTAPTPGKAIRFAVLADTQWQWNGPNRLAWVGDAIAAEAADCDLDFILHGGDLVESPSSYYWKHWFSSFESMLLASSFIPVPGNHEKNHRTYYEYFALPPGGGKDNERWWSLHWGDIVVVGIDTNVRSVADIKAQQGFLKEELSGAEPHKFVIFHHPVFSSDAYHGSGYSYDLIYHPIFVENGVEIVFNGHAHNYERIQRDGVTYMVVGGGGATPTALADTKVEGSVIALTDYNFYVIVETYPDRTDVRVVSVDQLEGDTAILTLGKILDEFSLPIKEASYISVPAYDG